MNDLFNSKIETHIETVFLHFDGGTPCNNPTLGYGIGYGSYRYNSGEIVRVDHGIPCSNNAAEILTLCVALERLAETVVAPKTAVHVWADSQVAIKWLKVAAGDETGGYKKRAKISKGSTPLFQASIRRLAEAASPFAGITAEWKPREWAVKAFGH